MQLQEALNKVWEVAPRPGPPLSSLLKKRFVSFALVLAIGFLNLYAGGIALPVTSTLSYRAGQTRANNAIVALGPAGDSQIWCGQSDGTAQVIVDVSGYFQ